MDAYQIGIHAAAIVRWINSGEMAETCTPEDQAAILLTAAEIVSQTANAKFSAESKAAFKNYQRRKGFY
jgi:hypothetical protein